MSLFEDVPPHLKDEFEFQLDHFRELRQKNKIKEDTFELISFRILSVFKNLLWTGTMTEDDILASVGFFLESKDLWDDFDIMLNELENQKGKENG